MLFGACLLSAPALQYHFMEVLHALCGRVCGAELPDMTESKLYDKLVKRLPDMHTQQKYTCAHFHAVRLPVAISHAAVCVGVQR